MTDFDFRLEKFSIPAGWSESGEHYEIELFVTLDAYVNDKRICRVNGKISREFPKYNAWQGNWWTYRLGDEVQLLDVPTNAVIQADLFMWELDDGLNDNDKIALSPYYNNRSLVMRFHPDRRIGFVVDGTRPDQDTGRTIKFGETRRIVGDDRHPSTDIGAILYVLADAGGGRSPGLTSPGKKVSPLKSDPTAACRTYALDAVKMNREAQRLGCGFGPPAWSNDHQMHFDWCMHGNNRVRIATENDKRARALDRCRVAMQESGGNKPQAQQAPQNGNAAGGGQPGNADPCDLYASEAVRLVAQASQRACGFSGPRWSADYQAHYNFCRNGAPPALLFAEHAAREQGYKACTGN